VLVIIACLYTRALVPFCNSLYLLLCALVLSPVSVMAEDKISVHEEEGVELVQAADPKSTNQVNKKDGGVDKRGDAAERTIKCDKCEKYFKKVKYVKVHEKRVHSKVDGTIPKSNSTIQSLNYVSTIGDESLLMDEKAEFSDMCSEADDTITEDKENKPPSKASGNGPATLKAFKCSQCDKKFGKKSYVKLHEKRIHTKDDSQRPSGGVGDGSMGIDACMNESISMEERPEVPIKDYVPDTISKDTVLNDETPKEKTYKCSQCDKMFGKKSYVRMHEKRVHKAQEASAAAKIPINIEEVAETQAVTVENVKSESSAMENKNRYDDFKILEEITIDNAEIADKVNDDVLAIPGPSKLNNLVSNIFETTSESYGHPISRIRVNKKEDDFKCKVCGLKFHTKRSQVKHFKGHGTYINQDFLTNFVDKENENTLKNQCLRKSSISLRLPNIENFPITVGEGLDSASEEEIVSNMMEGHNDVGKMSLSEICDDLMDLSDLFT